MSPFYFAGDKRHYEFHIFGVHHACCVAGRSPVIAPRLGRGGRHAWSV